MIVSGQFEHHFVVCNCHVIPKRMSRVSLACVHLPNLFAATNVFTLQSRSGFYEDHHPLQDQICSSLLPERWNYQEEIKYSMLHCWSNYFYFLKHWGQCVCPLLRVCQATVLQLSILRCSKHKHAMVNQPSSVKDKKTLSTVTVKMARSYNFWYLEGKIHTQLNW